MYYIRNQGEVLGMKKTVKQSGLGQNPKVLTKFGTPEFLPYFSSMMKGF